MTIRLDLLIEFLMAYSLKYPNADIIFSADMSKDKFILRFLDNSITIDIKTALKNEVTNPCDVKTEEEIKGFISNINSHSN